MFIRSTALLVATVFLTCTPTPKPFFNVAQPAPKAVRSDTPAALQEEALSQLAKFECPTFNDVQPKKIEKAFSGFYPSNKKPKDMSELTSLQAYFRNIISKSEGAVKVVEEETTISASATHEALFTLIDTKGHALRVSFTPSQTPFQCARTHKSLLALAQVSKVLEYRLRMNISGAPCSPNGLTCVVGLYVRDEGNSDRAVSKQELQKLVEFAGNKTVEEFLRQEYSFIVPSEYSSFEDAWSLFYLSVASSGQYKSPTKQVLYQRAKDAVTQLKCPQFPDVDAKSLREAFSDQDQVYKELITNRVVEKGKFSKTILRTDNAEFWNEIPTRTINYFKVEKGKNPALHVRMNAGAKVPFMCQVGGQKVEFVKVKVKKPKRKKKLK